MSMLNAVLGGWAVIASSLAVLAYWDRALYLGLWTESEEDVTALIGMVNDLLPTEAPS